MDYTRKVSIRQPYFEMTTQWERLPLTKVNIPFPSPSVHVGAPGVRIIHTVNAQWIFFYQSATL